MEKKVSKAELIIAGVGGQGVLFAGQVLALAAGRTYRHISYMPSYGTEKRGGHSECTVVLSDDDIASPVLDQAHVVMLLDGSQAKAYENRVRPQGMMIVEKTGLNYEPERTDFKFLAVSGLELALQMGSAVANNLIMLGLYTELTKSVPADVIIEEIEKKTGAREALLKQNLEAFSRGLALGTTLNT